MLFTIAIDLFKGFKKIVSIGLSTPRLGESFFDYEYLREFEAKIGIALNFEKGTHEEPISAKTPENPPCPFKHCLPVSVNISVQ